MLMAHEKLEWRIPQEVLPLAFVIKDIGLPKESFLRSLREKKKMSQRQLAKKMDIPRTQLQRLEMKEPSQFSLGEIKVLAATFNVPIPEFLDLLLTYVAGEKPKNLVRKYSLKTPPMIVHFQDKGSFASFVVKEKDGMVGLISLLPKQTLDTQQLPKAEYLFIHVLEGALNIRENFQEHKCGIGEGFTIQLKTFCQISNLHPLDSLKALTFFFSSYEEKREICVL